LQYQYIVPALHFLHQGRMERVGGIGNLVFVGRKGKGKSLEQQAFKVRV